jgi:glutamyl/glutaminyl-tRNA synthetase
MAKIINDPRPRLALTALGDEIAKQFKTTCRLAVTGKPAGPSLFHLLEVLGKEKVLARIEQALATIG